MSDKIEKFAFHFQKKSERKMKEKTKRNKNRK